jgi:hypothetical protein
MVRREREVELPPNRLPNLVPMLSASLGRLAITVVSKGKGNGDGKQTGEERVWQLILSRPTNGRHGFRKTLPSCAKS